MPQFLTPAFLQAFDASANPLVGAKEFIYQTGTTTLLSLFSDELLTTPQANPMISDSAGVFPNCFIAETKFKVVLKSSADVTLYTRDPVYSTGQADNVLAEDVTFDGTGIGFSSSNVQDAIVELYGSVAQLSGADFLGPVTATQNTTGTFFQAVSTDAGTGAGPNFETYRDSASPAASDILGEYLFYGKDSTGAKTLFASLRGVLIDPVNATEDGELILRTILAGTLADRLHIRGGAYMEGATGGDPGAGKFNATELQQDGLPNRPLVAGTAVTASGTTVDFTSIPSWAKRVTILWSGLSTNGTSNPIVQIGDSGGIETSGYLGAGEGNDGTPPDNYTSGFGITNIVDANTVTHGSMTLLLLDPTTFTWVATSVSGQSDAAVASYSGGSKSLSAVLDRVRFTTLGGVNTFDAGKINVMWE